MVITVGLESFELTDTEVKAAEWDMISIKDWVENAIRNKARQCIDQITLDSSNKQPGKISKEEKETIVMSVNIKSAKQRQAEFIAEPEK